MSIPLEMFSQGTISRKPKTNSTNTSRPKSSATPTYKKKAENKTFISGHEYVDLGLPSGLKWATCNVGASKPLEWGNYYSWSEVSPKYEYSIDTYSPRFLYIDKSFKIPDNITPNSGDDVARMNWGEPWRMPTVEDFVELIKYCTWKKVSLNGDVYWKITGPSNKHILLPSGGTKQVRTFPFSNEYIFYWSANRDNYNSNQARMLTDFHKSEPYIDRYYRYYGALVRPVFL